MQDELDAGVGRQRSPPLLPKLPRWYRPRVPPQPYPLLACLALEPLQLLVPRCITAKPPAKPRPHNSVIEIAAVGQKHQGDWSAITISVQNSQGDGLPEHQAGGELFGAIAERLPRFGAVDSPEADPRRLIAQEDGDRVAIGNADDAGFDIPRGGQETERNQDGKESD
jgi:hypothetical protein